MDYVVGSVAALVTGNVTPSRPRLIKRALTPTKHQPSPNVTPKSEFVEDRSIFLSPSMQKKKAIVKKSPKRIFQNPDLETTDNGEGNLSTTSPKADKVKKHLKDELEDSIGINKSITESKSPKNMGKNKKASILPEESSTSNIEQNSNENTPKKKKRKSNIVSTDAEIQPKEVVENTVTENAARSPKKMKERRKSVVDEESNKENDNNDVKIPDKSPKKQNNNAESTETSNTENTNKVNPKKKNKKRNKKQKQQQQIAVVTTASTENANESIENNQGPPKKKKNRKRKKSNSEQNTQVTETYQVETQDVVEPEVSNKKSKPTVNPNAITEKESDSEHESDNEIESENEEINKKVFEAEKAADESSDEEGDEEEEKGTKTEKVKKQKVKKTKDVKEKAEINTEDEIKRTLFIGNVPFSAKCKKEIKKIFNKHGQIETIRIRTVPVKDGRYTPKLAVIKNELHPERTTVNVYIRYAEEDSVTKALAENNTVLNEHHLRVSRSSNTGAEHDPKCSIFVGNLPFALEDEALRQKFENCGEIESVRIIRDKKTNAGKGFGYVNFTSKDGVELALALTEEDLTIKNRIIRVKRCTQLTNKQKQPSENKGGFKKQFNQRLNQGSQRNNQGGQRDNQGGQRDSQFGQRGNQSGQRGNQGGQRGNQGGQRGNQFGQRVNQGGQRSNQGGQKWNQGGPKWNQSGQKGYQGGQKYGPKNEEAQDGAQRRLMHKRKNQDASGGDGPPNKKQKNINQPFKEKKSRKEFVGLTAEKKKKHKFDKGQKKKKALSEILTK